MPSKYRCKPCKDSGVIPEWRRLEPFNPNSDKQVAALITHLGLKMPKKRGENRDTTESKYLKRFAKRHPVFRSVLDCRERQKIITAYMWQPGQDDRIHAQFGFHPSTWRKSCRNPNLQTIPKRVGLAKEFRKLLIAAPKHLFLTGDAAAIEAVLVGYAAGDPTYIRMAKAGIHAFLAANILGIPVDVTLPDDTLVAKLKEVKKANPEVYEAAKRCVHGSNYLLSAYGMHDEYPEYFKSQREAQEIQERYFAMCPKVQEWHRSTMERASKENYLENHFGYRHYFYCLSPETRILKRDLSWVAAGTLKMGDELVGFSEDISTTPTYCPSEITNLTTFQAPRLRIQTSKGTVTCTPNHRWLSCFRVKRYRVFRWMTAENLQVGDEIVQLCTPWEHDESSDSQWLSGILDGEGTVWKTKRFKSRGHVAIAQNPGLVHQRILNIAERLGWKSGIYSRKGHSCETIVLRAPSEWSALNIVGALRPVRLLEQVQGILFDSPVWQFKGRRKVHTATIQKIEVLPVGEVCAIETTTKTLIAEGLLSHNSVFQWNSKVGKWVMGEDAKRCVAFVPQSDASAVQTEDLLTLATTDLLPWLRLVIHDEFVLEVPRAEIDDAAATLRSVMTRPRPELGGLSIGAELKVGENLGEMSVI